ncbi:hypothetical protein [Planctomycetes bacterium K23_9]|uniref:HTTM domain-containing protein n=1 Tax=Stieleria marina TaxID=1930275 RepID=A0A517P192_9BACT|nr:hypothetical protein K239x_51390 [Planctomycetes bacterium K23_9]
MNNSVNETAWDRFWFASECPQSVCSIRGVFCVITAIYFASSMADVGQWYGQGDAFSQQNVASFFATADLQHETRWIWSPLFVLESLLGNHTWIHFAYLLVGIGLCVSVIVGKGGRIVPWLLWALFAGWANRILFLAGTVEILLSLCLFACAIAPPGKAWFRRAELVDSLPSRHWTAAFSKRLLGLQLTVFGIVTWMTMLSHDVWWNGLGSIALSSQIDGSKFGPASILGTTIAHEMVTHFLALALPIGLGLAWTGWFGASNRIAKVGLGVLLCWCLVVAVIGAHWLYAATFATACFALLPTRRTA